MHFPVLNLELLKNNDFSSKINISLPDEKLLKLPEKVLQFGTGVLLRGLPDYFIDKANKKGIFNGRVVMVKSTSKGRDGFDEQNSLYIHNIRGLKNGKQVNDYILNSSISRVINANSDWKAVLATAVDENITIIISNTTEVGLTYTEESIFGNPPVSFPAKLTACLYERFKKYEGDKNKGMVIIPTELVVDNGLKLKEMVRKLTFFNKLEPGFWSWLDSSNNFCNSLVDRIVPGLPGDYLKEEIYSELGFEDKLLIVSEPYKLWAIEGGTKVKDILSFHKSDKGIVIEKDITPYRERKLRILNGTHTMMVGLGYLAGLDTVGDCMNYSNMKEFVENIMMDEIVPSLDMDRTAAESFAQEVLERFMNASIHHPLINISLHYTSKMNNRNSLTIINYYRKFNEVPKHYSLGFAAYLLFMKAVKYEDGKYYGERNGNYYLINDDSAGYFYEAWKEADVSTHNSCKLFVEDIIDDDTLWNKELKAVPGLSDHIATFLFELITKGVTETLEEFVEFGEIEE
jgi:tagaturonate reductase